jgi:hypothetical protein
MTVKQRMQTLLTASDEILSKVDRLLEGQPEAHEHIDNMKLVTLSKEGAAFRGVQKHGMAYVQGWYLADNNDQGEFSSYSYDGDSEPRTECGLRKRTVISKGLHGNKLTFTHVTLFACGSLISPPINTSRGLRKASAEIINLH